MNEWSALADFHFLRPWWWLAAIPGLFTFYVVKTRTLEKSQWQNLIAPHLLIKLLESKKSFGLFHPTSVFLVVNSLTVVALAGPSWQREISPFAEDNTPLLIILDVSSSMNQRDVKPSRLIRAKQKVQDLMALRANSPTALIAYSGTAHRVIPLTDDANVITMLIQSLNTELMPVPGKFLEKTIASIDKTMGNSGNILVVTDGLGADSLQGFGSFCATSSHRFLIYSIEAAGLSSVAIPTDSRVLQELSATCNGVFQAMTVDKTDVERLDRELQRHFTSGDDNKRPWLDAGYYVLFPLAFFTLFWFRSGWTLNWVLLVIFVTPAFDGSSSYADDLDSEVESGMLFPAAIAWFSELSTRTLNDAKTGFLDLWMSRDQQGQFFTSRGEFKKAATVFSDPMRKGGAFYLAEEFDAAADVFSQIDSVEGLFNRANALAHARRYVAAVKTYNGVLERQPQHRGALKNKIHIQVIIDEVNQMSEAQQPEEGESSKELGGAPKTGEGAEKLNFDTQKITRYKAQDILDNPALNEIWMRQVEPDPANFLRVKFLMQQEGRKSP